MTTFVRTQELEHRLGEHGQLSLRVTSPDVEMRATDGDIARVRVTFEIRAADDAEADAILDRVRFHVTEGPGSLDVAEPKNGSSGIGSLVRLFGVGGGHVETRVSVDAPRGTDIQFDGVSADLTVTGFGGSQQYRTVSGDLVLAAAGGDVRIKGVSGDVSLRAEAALTSLDVNTVSGDVSAIAPRIEELRVATVSGDVEVEGHLTDGPGHRVETVSGDLSIGAGENLTVEVRGLSTDADIRLPHRSEGSRDRRRYIIGNGRPQLLFRSMSGDIEVRPPRRGAPNVAAATADDDGQLSVLQALERGEIDVEEATRRLASGSHQDV
ncbi:MAG TPA: DUF4097 family beta strand repeat-containing protein [Candidatus Limnocylindria bacterium]